MAIIKQPNQLTISPAVAAEAKKLYEESSSRWGVAKNEKAQQYAMFMQAYKGWSPQQTYTSILNYGYSQVDDFLRDANETYGRMFERGIERELGQITNALNPAKVANSVAAPSSEQMAKYKETIKNGIDSLKKTIGSQAAGLLTPEFYDRMNGAIASAASYFGKDFVKQVGGFQPGGSKNEITVDYIGQTTGSSQPQTFKINPKTGAFEAGEITPIQPAQPAQQGAVGTTVQPFAGTGNSKVDALVDKVLATPNQSTQNLQSYDWWKSAPLGDREAAYAQIQKITSSAQTMADYVKGKGLVNLQGFDWWSTSPHKQAAWSLIEQAAAQGQAELPKGENGLDLPEAGATSTPSATGDASYQRALEDLENNPDFQMLPESLKSLYRETLKNYDYNKEVNIDGVMQEFNRIKTQTIDPRFAKEVDKFTNELQKELSFQDQQREIELETERANAGQSIRQAKEGLSASGMTFTGKAIQELGKDSAYAQEGASATPTQTPFGGLFYEGNVNQASRLMSSSSALRYKKNLELLGQSAEDALGATGAVKQNIAGFTPSGNLPGQFEDQKQQQLGSTLSQLLGQNYQNASQRNDLQYNQ